MSTQNKSQITNHPEQRSKACYGAGKSQGFTRTLTDVSVSSRSERGFTLIETLVAIAILVVAIVAPLTLATQSLSASLAARDEITAFHLAQEAIEYIRNQRDQNMLEDANHPEGWLRDPIDRCFVAMGGNVGCTIDVHEEEIKKCGDFPSTCDPLEYDDSNNQYGYDGDPTHFVRTVTVVDLGGDALITVTMEWQSGPRKRSFTISERLHNWQQGIN